MSGSVFTSRITKILEIPGDPGQTVTIRKLAPHMLEASAKAAQRESLQLLRELGGAAVLKEIDSLRHEDVKGATRVDPLLQHDRIELLLHGILEWTYDAAKEQNSYRDLDLETQKFLATEILRLADPSLFRTEDEAATAQKNG